MSKESVEREINALVSGLYIHDKHRILTNLIRDLFGDVDEDGEEILVPGRIPDDVDLKNAVAALRDECFPASGAADDRL